MFGFMTTFALVSPPADSAPDLDQPGAQPYRQSGQGASQAINFPHISSVSHVISNDEIFATAAGAFRKFAALQVPLDREISELLSANLWALYSR